jgi:hypothetical protein
MWMFVKTNMIENYKHCFCNISQIYNLVAIQLSVLSWRVLTCTTSPLQHLFLWTWHGECERWAACDTAIVAQSSDIIPYSVLAPVLKTWLPLQHVALVGMCAVWLCLCTCAYLTFSWTIHLDAVTVKLHGKGKGLIIFYHTWLVNSLSCHSVLENLQWPDNHMR